MLYAQPEFKENLSNEVDFDNILILFFSTYTES